MRVFAVQEHCGSPAASRTIKDFFFCTTIELDGIVRRHESSDLQLLSFASGFDLLKRVLPALRLGVVRLLGDSVSPIADRIGELGYLEFLRIAIIAPYGWGYGDSLLFLTLLRNLRAVLEDHLASVELDLFQSFADAEVHTLYETSGAVNRIFPLPSSLARLKEYHAYFDFSCEYVRGDCPWIDGLLEAAGIDPAVIDNSRKRNSIPMPSGRSQDLVRALDHAKASGLPLLLFHATASTPLRSIPKHVANALATRLLQSSQVVLARADGHWENHLQPCVDLSGLSRTFADFTYIIANCDGFISVDTSLYHIADAFDIPGVVLFTTTAPYTRCQYYPNIEGLFVCPDSEFAGMHWSDNPETLQLAEAYWERVELDVVVEKTLGMIDETRSTRRSAVNLNGWHRN